MEREGNLRAEMLSRQILMLKKKSFHALSLCDSSDPSAILTQTHQHAACARACVPAPPFSADGWQVVIYISCTLFPQRIDYNQGDRPCTQLLLSEQTKAAGNWIHIERQIFKTVF